LHNVSDNKDNKPIISSSMTTTTAAPLDVPATGGLKTSLTVSSDLSSHTKMNGSIPNAVAGVNKKLPQKIVLKSESSDELRRV
jgi:hypothetical protein